jgi:hypothetical protein
LKVKLQVEVEYINRLAVLLQVSIHDERLNLSILAPVLNAVEKKKERPAVTDPNWFRTAIMTEPDSSFGRIIDGSFV